MNPLAAAVVAGALAIAAQGLPAVHALSGRVIHGDLPVPGATITAVKDQRTLTTTSDEKGAFRFTTLQAGVWTISVEMRGFTTVTRDIMIPFSDPELRATLTMRRYEEIVDPSAPATAWPAATTLHAPEQAVTVQPQDVVEILSGSVVNGAATPFAQPRAVGNNRPRPPALYSGALSAQLGNSAWNARPYSFAESRPPSPEYANAQFGIAFRGPLWIPFLVRYGPTTQILYSHGVQHTTSMQSALVPTLAERAGDFSGRRGVIRDPETGAPFPGNVIPPDRIAPQAAALAAYYPRPTDATATGANFQRPLLNETTSDQVQVQVTKNVGLRSVFSGSFGYQRSIADAVNLFDFRDEVRQSTLTAGLTLTRRLTPRLNLRLSYQFTRSGNRATPFFANRVDVSGEAGIAGNAREPLNWGPPTLAFPDVADLRDGVHQRSTRHSHAIGGQMQLQRGRHSLTVGGDARLNDLDLLTPSDPRGTLTFTGAATGSAFADFLLGIPTTSAMAQGSSAARLRGGSYDLYANDDIRVTAGLTVNAGVRWEYESPYTERDGRLANLDVRPDFTDVAVVVGSSSTGPLSGADYPASLVRRDLLGIQPRLGLSWRPSIASSVVIRGGYGLYRNLGVYQSIGTLLAHQPPFSTAFNVENSDSTPLTLANPFPASVSSSPTFAVDPDFRTARLHSWQMSVQRNLPASLTVLVSVFVDRGTHLAQAFLPNTYPPGGPNPCAGGAAPTRCPSGFAYLVSAGSSKRHAAQFMLRRRLHAGLTATASYTIAEAEDDGATFSNTTVAPGSLALAQDWLNPRAEWGPSSFDQRHLLSVELQYTTGVGVIGGTLVDSLWGTIYKDWTVTAQLNTGSGLPVTPLFFAVVPGTGIVGMRPSLTGVAIAPIETGAYANAAAFTAPLPGTWGDAGRHSIRGPSTFAFDMSLARAFRLPGRTTIEWRVMAINVLNRVTFTSIDRIVASPQFGRATTASPMRRIETSFRFSF